MKFPKVLLACPTSDHKLYCQDEWIENIKKLDYPNLHILIVDNSKTQDNAKLLTDKFSEIENAVVVYRTPKETIRFTLVDCCNFIRDYIKQNKFDYWFSLESDVFTPPNIIQYLLCHRKQVIGCTYFHLGGDDTILLQYHQQNVNGYITQMQKPLLLSFIDADSKINTVIQGGLGCLLVRGDILRKVKFRYDPTEFAEGFHDYFFHADLQRLEIPVYTDYSVIVEHRNNSNGWNQIINH